MSTPFDFFSYKGGKLCAEDLPLSRIAREHGTPVYVYSTQAFLKPLRQIQSGLAAVDHLVCFALKSNSNLSIIKTLAQAGAGMDLVSGGELFRALRAGVDPQKIVFSGVGKTKREMIEALDASIFSFNVESVAELELLSKVAAERGVKAPVALRFNPDVDPKTHPYISTGLKKNKFGINRKEVLVIAKSYSNFPGIDLRGISIHIGSQLTSLSPLRDAFGRARALINELNQLLPKPLTFVDLGGGVGIQYRNEKPPTLRSYTDLILKFFGPKSQLSHPLKVLIEPGRTLSGNSGILLTEVLYRKERGSKSFVVIDAAMNDLIRPSLYGSYHEIVPVEKDKSQGKKNKTNIVGPVCESSDCFASDRMFPRKVDQGDLVAILSAGAYGFTMSSNYNSRPRPPEVLVNGTQAQVIRTRESYVDLIKGEK